MKEYLSEEEHHQSGCLVACSNMKKSNLIFLGTLWVFKSTPLILL